MSILSVATGCVSPPAALSKVSLSSGRLLPQSSRSDRPSLQRVSRFSDVEKRPVRAVYGEPAVFAARQRGVNNNTGYRFASTDVPVPSMGESITEGSINHWKKNVGERVEVDEIVAVVDTDKINVDILSPVAGVIDSVKANEGDTVMVGQILFTVDTEGVAQTAPAAAAQKSSENESVMKYAEEESKQEHGSEQCRDGAQPAREEKRVPMSRMRQKIAERLKSAQDTSASLTTFQECDMSAAMKLRRDIGPDFLAKHGTKLGFMSLFLTACAKALEEMPAVNSSIDGTDLIVRNFVDISVAVATPTGLTVPVIRDVGKKNVMTLEKELAELAAKARTGKISLADMQGGSFTISNGGVYGSMIGTPILNPPQSAILGMHSIIERPVAKDGRVQIRPMMYLALTYDHQVIDGREAVLFLRRVAELIENPAKLVLGL